MSSDHSISPEKPQSNSTSVLRIVLTVLRWLAVVLLAGLVVAGLYVQVPWKITALLMVMLAGLTIIRGRVRTFFWVGFATVALGIGVWTLIPETDDGQWQRWPLDEEIAAFNARFSITPEDNAATIYEALLEARDWNQISDRLRQADPEDKAQAGLWDDNDLPELAELLAELAPELQQLRAAAQKQKCFFDITPSVYALPDLNERLIAMRYWSFLLLNRSFQRTHANQKDDTIVMTQFGKQLCSQPTTMDILVGLAIRSTGIQRLKEILVNQPLSEEQLDEIERAIQQSIIDIETIWKDLVDYEKLSAKDIVALMYQVHPSGTVRSARVSQMVVNEMPNTYWMSVLEKWVAVMMWFVMPNTPEPLFDIIDLAYEPLYTFPPPEDLRLDCAYYPFQMHWNVKAYIADGATHTQTMMSTLYHYLLPKQECHRKGALLLSQLRRFNDTHHRWPESLEELLPDTPMERLIDPFSGEWFVYERSEDGFVLYSTGMETWGIDLDDFSRTKEHKMIEIWP